MAAILACNTGMQYWQPTPERPPPHPTRRDLCCTPPVGGLLKAGRVLRGGGHHIVQLHHDVSPCTRRGRQRGAGVGGGSGAQGWAAAAGRRGSLRRGAGVGGGGGAQGVVGGGAQGMVGGGAQGMVGGGAQGMVGGGRVRVWAATGHRTCPGVLQGLLLCAEAKDAAPPPFPPSRAPRPVASNPPPTRRPPSHPRFQCTP
jgi:hypothetical protein